MKNQIKNLVEKLFVFDFVIEKKTAYSTSGLACNYSEWETNQYGFKRNKTKTYSPHLCFRN